MCECERERNKGERTSELFFLGRPKLSCKFEILTIYIFICCFLGIQLEYFTMVVPHFYWATFLKCTLRFFVKDNTLRTVFFVNFVTIFVIRPLGKMK